jgi:hypothetical protein
MTGALKRASAKRQRYCQARFGFGGDLTRWKDANFVGYEGHVVHNITKDRKEITRLIFNVSGESRTVDETKISVT